MEKSPRLLFIGDSHIRYFTKAAAFDLFHPYEVDRLEVGGATAVGMRNPNSKTNAIERYRTWMRDKDRESVVVLHLGEVDCGFVIWYRADKYDEPVEAQMRESIAAYFEFVDELTASGFNHVIITGATLPTISDEDLVGEVVIKRSSITATQAQRTALTLAYNAELRAGAEARGLSFVDIAQDIIDPATGVVDAGMRNPNPDDHHMNVPVAAAHWAHRLLPHLEQITTPGEYHWRATRDTFLKAYPAHSSRMDASMIVPVPAGQIVVAEEVVRRSDYAVVRNVRYRGRNLPLIRILQTNHFKRLV